MDNLTKTLFIKGVIGVIFAVIGYIGFFVGGDLEDFMGRAMPGILLGFFLMNLLIVPKENKYRIKESN